MRVVAGKHRGRRLAAPAGGRVRPTADRVREALFNVLAHKAFGPDDRRLPQGARVIDAFAGSGALGFEALSRGAAHVTFLETGAEALRVIRKNAEALEEAENVTIRGRDATRPGPAEAPCALAFLDPPYGRGLAVPTLAALVRDGWLADGALAVVELSTKEPFTAPPGFEAVDERHYGDTRVVLLRYK